VIPNFEWDLEKARVNARKHGVAFEEAATVFGDDEAWIYDDVIHSVGEVRLIIIGISDRGRLLTVSYTYRGENTRIISARAALPHEKRLYEEKPERS